MSPVALTSASAETMLALTTGVEFLCLDAGNVVIFLDHARLARVVTGCGFAVDAAQLIASEGFAKRAAEHGNVADVPFAYAALPGARPWALNMATLLRDAGVPGPELSSVLDAVWREHAALNLWNQVPEGLAEALSAYRAQGGKTALISNSEGMLEQLFAPMPVRAQLDLLLDSGVVGIEKPDARIFEMALAHFGVRPDQALHLGDTFLTDILGARAAGLRYALIDPFDQYQGKHADVPRVPSAAAVAQALTRTSSKTP
jgi:putative hydrolase of the HAD superfamily